MTITTELIADRLKEAEQNLQGALKAVEHWGGRVAELRDLKALLDIEKAPEPQEPAK